MKTKSPKSPQSPVKRAKRARLMWADLGEVERANHGPLTPTQHYSTQSPVHVLDASEAAHEQRLEAGAKALFNEYYRVTKSNPMPKAYSWERRTENEKEGWKAKARAALASVYSAPAGKGKTK